MAIEMSSDRAICSRCGTAYTRRSGFFSVSHAMLHKGLGYIPICKGCIEAMYSSYLSQCNSSRDALRQMCRKLDLFWSDAVYEAVIKKSSSRTLMTQYLAKLNTITYAGKSYDDTLLAEGTLWSFNKRFNAQENATQSNEGVATNTNQDSSAATEDPSPTMDDIAKDVRVFWGSGYTPEMYIELEQRRQYWMSKLGAENELDVGTEALVRQLCALELDINRDRAAGKSVEKSVTALNSLLGSANLKPVQKKQDEADTSLANTPMGVWLYRYENKRPLPEIDDELKDVNGLKRYIFTWMGHLCKMLGLKNGYTQLYQNEIEKYRVERPEYDGEDDETMYADVLSESDKS